MLQHRVRILIAEDHDVASKGIKGILAEYPEMVIVDVLKRGDHILPAIQRHCPNILLLDLKMEATFNPTNTLRTIHQLEQRPRVIVVSAHVDYYIISHREELGVFGYLHKEDALSEMLPQGIRCVSNGNYAFSAGIATMLRQVDNYQEKNRPNFSREQYEVLVLMVMGLDSQQIADRTNRSVEAERGIEQRIRERLGVGKRDHVIIKAIQEDLVPLELLGRELD